jgi:hypothetical protein
MKREGVINVGPEHLRFFVNQMVIAVWKRNSKCDHEVGQGFTLIRRRQKLNILCCFLETWAQIIFESQADHGLQTRIASYNCL